MYVLFNECARNWGQKLMHEVLTNTMRLIKSKIELRKKLPVETIPYLLKAVQNADNSTKNDIENQLVKIGEEAIPHLIKELFSISGTARGVVAMALIRIGSPSISYLKNASNLNPEFKWIADYLITEIEGTQKSLTSNTELQAVAAV